MKVNYAATDATALPYESSIFDLIFALDVLEHVPDERAAISEIKRITVENGTAVISVPIEVGIPIIVRESYRFVDEIRQETESLSEIWDAFFRTPATTASGV